MKLSIKSERIWRKYNLYYCRNFVTHVFKWTKICHLLNDCIKTQLICAIFINHR